MDVILSLQEAIECAKKFKNPDDVYMAVSLHPEWLTAIPGDRQWAIIHHVTYSGDIVRLDRLLGLQTSNKDFRLLVESRSNETILDIAKLLKDERSMFKHIERLIKLDEMLNYAINCEWNKCYEIVQENPEYGNQKPPYRRFFLIHHMACVNAIQEFERFKKIKGFNFIMNLRADRKKINQIARENNGIEFAEYIEKNYSSYFEDDEEDDKLYEPSIGAKKHTDIVNTLMVDRNISEDLDLSFSPAQNTITRGELDRQVKDKLIKQQQEIQRARNMNKVITENSIDTVRNLLKCSLTHAIVTDPVVAADGFTYERSAIENWLKTNDYSPMTYEKLSHKYLNPNLLLKQILITLTQT